MNQSINIMTSADENLMPFITIQILSIIDSLPSDVKINYFLLYDTEGDRESKLKNIEKLQAFSALYNNLVFEAVDIGNIELFKHIAYYGGYWACPAYYPLVAHKLLPKCVDRVLYLDAGDVFVQGDFREYYFMDFSNHLIIATPGRYKVVDDKLEIYDSEDLYDLSLCDGITRGVFNSGSYIMNLQMMRQIDFSEEDYIVFAETLAQLKKDIAIKEHEYAYWGDQGFLSAFFLGKIKYYGYPDITNLWYMPFNFCLWYYDRMDKAPWYTPVIVHFAGAPKPWTVKYPYDASLTSPYHATHKISDLQAGQREYYFFWHEYAIKSEMIQQTQSSQKMSRLL